MQLQSNKIPNCNMNLFEKLRRYQGKNTKEMQNPKTYPFPESQRQTTKNKKAGTGKKKMSRTRDPLPIKKESMNPRESLKLQFVPHEVYNIDLVLNIEIVVLQPQKPRYPRLNNSSTTCPYNHYKGRKLSHYQIRRF